ncbi:hypothetical protein E1B28_004325 [Marasmius oreades]|uniref:Uncharacterized protein n=1 Tax=Marasmius oreades TaxID=181124 RepID=A0A9P7UYA5_9AGAR|nr:uncharacterized protein E1B28_004325 [Marasmius oreades]KAG7096924.1 hypothetical protein E1B28_004325 [Marasmius oreades]
MRMGCSTLKISRGLCPRKGLGSVCMTPSTVTSFGPSDYTLPSPIPSSERAFTPDLGYRLYEDVPLTPTTATSWGPPTEYPPSTYSTRSVFSLGLAHRLTFSRPTTPTTATSWGPASWPSSPVESAESDAVSIHLGDRGSFSCPVTPSTATSWGAPLSYPPSPASPFYVRTPDAGERIFQEGTPRKLPWVHNWPYRDTSEPSQARDEATPWAHGWPYVTEALTHMSPWIYGWPYQGTQEASRSGVLDYAGPWNHGWPYRQKAATTRMVIDNSKLSASKDMHVHFETLSTKDDAFQPGVDLRLGYPYFQLYPTGYPDNVECIYPQAIEGYLTNSQPGYPYNLYQIYPVIPKHVISSHLGPQIGRSHPDPTVYPGNLAEIYPRSAQCFPPRSLGMRQTINVRVVPSYPVFQLYHNVYPWNLEEIYPVLVIQGDDIKSGQSYPFFNLYPAVYPHFDLYPSVLKSLVPLNDLSGADPIAPPSISVDVEVWYPIMVIYRPVYPFLSVYVDLPEDILKLKTPLTIALCEYAYPDIIVYPPLLDVIESDGHLKAPPVDLGLLKYPFFDLYPATYPHFDIYPPIPGQIDSKHVTLDVIVNYPVFDLYPAIYPYMNLYPPASGKMEHEHDIHGLVNINYPVLDLYPVVYPHFSLYPPISGLTVEEYGISMRLHPKYPEFELYPSVYPHFSLWPATQPWMQSRTVTRTRKTHAQLHDLVLLEAPQITELHHEVLRTVAATGKVEKYKAHSELQELFSQPAGVGTASDIPISTVQVLEMRTESQSSQPPWIRSSSVSRRPVKIVPSPTEGLLPRSSHNSFVAEPAASQPHPNRPSQISPTESQSHSFPQVVQSLHRSASSSTSDSHAHASDRSSALPPVNERTTITSLARSSSLSDTSRSRYKTTVSTTSKSPTPLPRKRDSLVLQRVRAINASEDDDISVLSLANKFPMPPRPPLASRPPL